MSRVDQKEKVYFESVLLTHPGSEEDSVLDLHVRDGRVLFRSYSEELDISPTTARALAEALIVAARDAEEEHRKSYARLRAMQTSPNIVSLNKVRRLK